MVLLSQASSIPSLHGCLCVCMRVLLCSEPKQDLSFAPLKSNLFKDLQCFSEVKMFFPLILLSGVFVI